MQHNIYSTMVLEEDDQRRVDEAVKEAENGGSTKVLVRNASRAQKLGPITVICMIFNRTIGN